MRPLLDTLAAGELLIADGAMGTYLQARGLEPGECPESWCLSHPDVVREHAAAYLATGAQIVQTNSFGGTCLKLAGFGLAGQAHVLNVAAARLAKEVVGDRCLVAATVGPTGRILEDEGGDCAERDVFDSFREQVLALAEGGAAALCIATMSSVLEAALAIRAARENASLPVICTFTFAAGRRGFRTMMGVDPARATHEALAAGAHVVGANCGNGIAEMVEVAARIRAAAPVAPVLLRANAGAPVLENGRTVFKESPAQMAARVDDLVAARANVIGGCCGVTPEHVAAIARAAPAHVP